VKRVLYLGDYIVFDKYTLEKTEETIKNGQSRETGNIGTQVTERRHANQEHNTENRKKQHGSCNFSASIIDLMVPN
jgi:hypothetical protein